MAPNSPSYRPTSPFNGPDSPRRDNSGSKNTTTTTLNNNNTDNRSQNRPLQTEPHQPPSSRFLFGSAASGFRGRSRGASDRGRGRGRGGGRGVADKFNSGRREPRPSY